MQLIQIQIKNVRSAINKGHTRSIKAKKNIIASILIKGVSIGISIILVPLTINYINPSRYGIWLTVSSIIGWFSFFDVGLTQGLRNKFAEAKAKGEDENAQIYVSTTYAVLVIIFFTLWTLFIFINQFLNWSSLLNLPVQMGSEISEMALIVITYFCMQFVLNIVSTIVIADQRPAIGNLIGVLGQFASLIAIFILVKTTQGSLIRLSIALCLSPIVVYIGANYFFFVKGPYKNYRPKWSKVRFSYAKGLFNLGIIFFVIQIANVLQFETANIIIARNFGTANVTSYNIVYKYFGLLNMIFLIFLNPFWSASTEAYLNEDLSWIKNAMKKYNLLNAILLILGFCMLIFSQQIYTLWLGKGTINISFALSFWGFAYFNLSVFGGKFVSFLNGISALRIQFIANLISPFLYVVIALLLINYYKMGVYSLFIAAAVSNFNTFFLAPLQYYKIIYKKKRGIWTK